VPSDRSGQIFVCVHAVCMYIVMVLLYFIEMLWLYVWLDIKLSSNVYRYTSVGFPVRHMPGRLKV
jgi:hypothetical protein